MLTFILLVVLGGGVGLLVVSLAESSKPTVQRPRSERGDGADAPAAAEPALDQPEVHDSVAGPGTHDLPVEAPAPLLVVPGATPHLPSDEHATQPRRQPAEPVPRSRIAVEGRFADVARVPLWRRLLAVVGILVITVTTGVALAAILAAVIGALAELVGNTIG